MKSIISIPFGILSAVLLNSCSGETLQEFTATGTVIPKSKPSGTVAANRANPYDYIGAELRDLWDAYKAGGLQPSSFTEVIYTVHYLRGQAATANYGTQPLLSGCMNDGNATFGGIIAQSGLSPAAKTGLTALINTFEVLQDVSFNEAYTELVNIENATAASLLMTSNDKRVILTVTAIYRYSLYHSCCEDTDWGKSVGNIIAASAGAIHNEDLAIDYILITSIAGLEKIQL